MKVLVTARHFPLTAAIEQFVKKKLSHFEGLVHGEARIHAILAVDQRQHSAEFILHADHVERRAFAASRDLYDAVNKSVKILEREVVAYQKKEREVEIRKLRKLKQRGMS